MESVLQLEDDSGDREPDLVCVGESMAMFVPDRALPMSEATWYRPTVAGAESNVAAFAAALGLHAAWISRVGDDPFGAYLVRELDELGVDVRFVARDSVLSTGVAFKEPSVDGTRVRYFRRGSAASEMNEQTARIVRRLGSVLVHLSGITPALSGSCKALVESLVTDRPPGSIVSFDVNWRPSLWNGRDPNVVLDLAREADIVFVGQDEAEDLWGVRNVEDVRRILPEPTIVVVKQGAAGATAFSGGESVFVSSLDVPVVEPVGAGDAFAAGFLVGTRQGLEMRARLRLGNIVAAAALRVSSDVGPLPPADVIETLLALDEEEWRQVRLEPLVDHSGV